MNPIPQTSTDESKNVAQEEGYDEQCAGGDNIERSDDVDGLYHMRPKDEVQERLRPAGRDQPCPNQMPSTDEYPDHETDFVWIDHMLVLGAMILRVFSTRSGQLLPRGFRRPHPLDRRRIPGL